MLRVLLEHGASWLHFVALVIGVGGGLGYWLLAPALQRSGPQAQALATRLRRSSDRALRVGGIVLVPAFGVIFARQLAGFRDPFVPLSDDVALLLRTDWGAAWRWGAAVAAVACVALVAAGGTKAGRLIGGVALMATGIYPAFTGHAAGIEPRALAVSLDVAHVWAASAWVGGLGMLVVGLRLMPREGEMPRGAVAALVGGFSPVALAAVALLVGSGVWASVQHLESPGNLFATAWGRLLTVKLVLVSAAMALGFRNWRRLTPGLGSAAGDRAMRRSATVELVMAHLALAATAVLIRTGPG